MTAQAMEKIIYNGNSTILASNPGLPKRHPQIRHISLEEEVELAYDPSKGHEIFIVGSTACWRRYIGTWEIIDKKLFLNNLFGYYKLQSNEPLFANWVSEVLRIPTGKELKTCQGYFDAIYEHEIHVDIQKGMVTKTLKYQNSLARSQYPREEDDSLESEQAVYKAIRASLPL